MQSDKSGTGSTSQPAENITPETDQNAKDIPLWRDQRRHRRVQLTIDARFLLPDQTEHTGAVHDISAGGVALSSDTKPEVGDKIIVYIDEMGGYEGRVVRTLEVGFSVEFESSPAKRERTVNQLTWVANKPTGTAIDDRQYSRKSVSQNSMLLRADGIQLKCSITDMSVGGMAIKIADKPPIGEIIMIGRMEGRVVRHFPEGVGIEFLKVPQNRRTITQPLF